MRGRVWVKLHERWYDDPVLRACAAVQPAVLVLWPMLVAMAKQHSSPTNEAGTIKTTRRQLAESALVSENVIGEALAVMAEGELVEVVEGKLILRVTLPTWAAWNPANGTARDRSLRHRHDANESEAFAGETAPVVTDANGSVTVPCQNRLEKNRGEQNRAPANAPTREGGEDGGGGGVGNPVQDAFRFEAAVSDAVKRRTAEAERVQQGIDGIDDVLDAALRFIDVDREALRMRLLPWHWKYGEGVTAETYVAAAAYAAESIASGFEPRDPVAYWLAAVRDRKAPARVRGASAAVGGVERFAEAFAEAERLQARLSDDSGA